MAVARSGSRSGTALSSVRRQRRGARGERGNMSELRTLAIDIGGTGIKAVLLDGAGHVVSDRQRVPTPAKPIAPEVLLHAIDEAITPLGAFDRVSVGFPGYVRDGRVLTAPNLGSETLGGFDLQQALSDHWKKPVRVLNDADVQGF